MFANFNDGSRTRGSTLTARSLYNMKHVSILVPNEAVLASIVDPRTLLIGANDFLKAADKSPMFDVQLVGLTKDVRLHDSLFSVHTDV